MFQEIEQQEQRLRKRYELLREMGIVRVKTHLQMARDFLESDEDVVSILRHLESENYRLPSTFSKYKMTFQDLDKADLAILKSVMRNVSNDVIARALVKQPKTSAIWAQVLGEARFKLIESIKSRYGHIKADEIKQAQFEILKTYWSES